MKELVLTTGDQKLNWAGKHMPVLQVIEERFLREKPFKGIKIAVCIHLEAKTARLCEVLQSGGAEVFLAGSNPLSTQDDVAQAIARRGVAVFAKYGCSEDEYLHFLEELIKAEPNIILDDGGDVIHMIHERYPEYIPQVIGGCEETTTGVIRMKARDKAGHLKFPMISVNDAMSKYLFDNRYGTGQSVWTGIMQTTNLLVAGKTVVVAGYGWCGKGVASKAKGLGADVIVTEIDPLKAIEAVMDGFQVMPMKDACPLGDIHVTVTGCCEVISREHFDLLKEGAILTNAGHFNVEVDFEALEKYAVEKREVRKNVMEYTLPGGKRVFLIAEGRLVNLASGDGHPVEIMDTSFALQALCAEYLVNHKLEAGVYDVTEEIDGEVARLKLHTLGFEIDSLTPKQEAYLKSYIV
ncbi:adenosylhomocysteinase [Candidatus Contubernalis alkaliaceticus]|uniref:adenosylhomocysteinase n=1 Tax=Candidatus Contubernalis alkaliaceticus TaxID=338645 RepID=UPI001F4C1A7D|nr:adenosylhomocysteinase [Candidatus Contubernalis alkalaceticus]UNC93471.1 adenosylhomocysteinase [Candidatus Contubernalis alkalaceticus]